METTDNQSLTLSSSRINTRSISEQEDDEKSQFKELPANVSLQEAENDLLAQNNPPLPKSTALVGLARHK